MWTVQFFSKNEDGITHYLKHHAATNRAVLAPFSQCAIFTRRVFRLAKQVHPTRGARTKAGATDPNAVSEAKLLGSSRRPVTAEAFNGAHGNKSNEAEFSTSRFSDFKPHRHMVSQEFLDSKRISKAHENDTRFYVRCLCAASLCLPPVIQAAEFQFDPISPCPAFSVTGLSFCHNPRAASMNEPAC